MDHPLSHVKLYYGLKLVDQFMRDGNPSKAVATLTIIRDMYGFDHAQAIIAFWAFQEPILKRPLQ
jgi:hypothetical protein